MDGKSMPVEHLAQPGGLFRRLRRLLRDRCATVSIEFAFALPILLGMTFALYEVTEGVITYMKVTDVANTVSDLIGQVSQAESGVADSDLDNYYTAAQMVMMPSTGTNLGIAIASVYFDNNGANPKLCWHAERGGAAAISNATTFVSGLGGTSNPNGSTLVVQASYTYNSLLNYFITTPFFITAEVGGQPRNLLPPAYLKGVPYPPNLNPATYTCPVP
jgi:Flp pilus assembly protein TadG